jgi:hypothetical protein
MKIRVVEIEMFHADGRTDRHTGRQAGRQAGMTKLIVVLRSSEHALQ